MKLVALSLFQSTRPQGARQDYAGVAEKTDEVSIHAPAGGATKRFNSMIPQKQVSIHAPAGGATQKSLHNTRSLRVSIHAPAGGATRWLTR